VCPAAREAMTRSSRCLLFFPRAVWEWNGRADGVHEQPPWRALHCDMPKTKPGLLLLAVLAAAPTQAQGPPAVGEEQALSPLKILLTVKRVYATCRSYRDTGVARTTGRIEGGQFGSELPFATAFSRPGRFRFQFTDQGMGERSSRYIVWWDGKDVRSWWDAQPGVRRPSSLQEALDAASGISAGASLRVPGLLLPEVVGTGPPLLDPEGLDDDDDRGVPCFRIRGRPRPTPYTLTTGTETVTVEEESVTYWIDRTRFIIRKVEDSKNLTTYRSVTTTTYEPQMDVDIPAAELSFNPPTTAIRPGNPE
jgi:hypothetical protein